MAIEMENETETTAETECDDICDDCYFEGFHHLTDEAIRNYLRTLVDYLDDMDAGCPPEIDEDWRSLLGLTRAGI